MQETPRLALASPARTRCAWLGSLALGLLLVALTITAYVPATCGGFLWDDNDHIEQCPPLRSVEGLRQIWLEPGATIQYYPLTFTCWWVGYQLWGLTPAGPTTNPAVLAWLGKHTWGAPWPDHSPWPYHLLNVLMHAAVALLFWRVLRVLRVPGAYLAGLIFALHPVHVMSVAWMTELKNSLSGALFLGALWAYLRFAGVGVYEVGPAMPAAAPAGDPKMAGTAGPTRWGFYALALFLFVLAMFAKTATSLLVCTLLLILWWQRRRMGWREVVLLAAVVAGSATLVGIPALVLRHPALAPRLDGLPLLLRALGGVLPGAPPEPQSWLVQLGVGLGIAAAAVLAVAAVLGLHPRTRYRDVLPLAPLVFISMALGRITLAVERIHGARGAGYDNVTMIQKVLIAGRAFWFYLGKLLYPYPLTFFYQRWKADAQVWWQYLFPAAFVLLVAGLFLARRRLGRAPLAAVLHNFVGSAGLIFIVVTYMTRYTWVSDHWQYLSSMSLMALGAAALTRLWQRAPACVRPAGYGLAAVLAGVLVSLSWRQCHPYRDCPTLWRDTLAQNPACFIAHNNLGAILYERGEQARAREHYLEALEEFPDYGEAKGNLGNTELDRANDSRAAGDAAGANQHYAEAQRLFEEALKLDPNLYATRSNLGTLLVQAGRLTEARNQFERAIAINPCHPELHYNLGNLCRREGRPEEAIASYQRAIALRPTFGKALSNLGATLNDMGRWEEARAYLGRAVICDPRNAIAHGHRAACLAALGQDEQALAEAQLAVRLEPATPDAWATMAGLSLRRHQPADALNCCRQALQYDPGHLEARQNLAEALARTGRFADAVTVAEELLPLAQQANRPQMVQEVQRRLQGYQHGKVE